MIRRTSLAFQPLALLMDFYVVLGVRADGDGRRHQAGVPAARAAVSPGRQSRRPARPKRASRQIARGVRDVERSGAAAALRHAGRGRRRPGRRRRRVRRLRFLGSVHAVQQAATFGDLFADVFTASGGRAAAPSAAPICIATCRWRSTRPCAAPSGVTVTRQARVRDVRRRRRRSRTPVVRARSARAPARCARRAATWSSREPCARVPGTRAVQRTARAAACGGQRPRDAHRNGHDAGAGRRHDGARLRVPGKGNAGRTAARAGDFYVSVHVAPHPRFRREGDDLHLVVPVAVHEAALGARIEVPTLDGPARLRVPPGTQSGQQFRLRETRRAVAAGGRRGDLVDRGAAGAAAAARRAIEGTAAGIRTRSTATSDEQIRDADASSTQARY